MNYLIKPAVTLMNRLPLVYKFSLISILFLGPILVLAWLVISGLNQSVQTLDRGMDGLEELRTVENLLAASLRYRDYQAPGIVNDEPALLSQAEEAANEVSNLLAALAEDYLVILNESQMTLHFELPNDHGHYLELSHSSQKFWPDS